MSERLDSLHEHSHKIKDTLDYLSQLPVEVAAVLLQTLRPLFARSNDIDMVMHFSDAIAPADIYHPLNIQRKLQSQGCMPMYMQDGMDITIRVTEMLNSRLRGAGNAAPARQN